MAEPVVLISTDTKSGKLTGVGLYEDIEMARYEVSRKATPDNTFSLWTPSMNSLLPHPACIGLTGVPYKTR